MAGVDRRETRRRGEEKETEGKGGRRSAAVSFIRSPSRIDGAQNMNIQRPLGLSHIVQSVLAVAGGSRSKLFSRSRESFNFSKQTSHRIRFQIHFHAYACRRRLNANQRAR